MKIGSLLRKTDSENRKKILAFVISSLKEIQHQRSNDENYRERRKKYFIICKQEINRA